MARVQRGRVGPFERSVGGLLVVTGVCVCAHNWRLPLEPFPGKAGGKGKERKGKKGNPAFCGQKSDLGPHTFFDAVLSLEQYASMGRGCSLVRK